MTRRITVHNIKLSEDFRGNLYITQHGKIIADCHQGFADLPNKRPNNKDTRFASASAGKVFVAVKPRYGQFLSEGDKRNLITNIRSYLLCLT
jgi:hypothetical protein